MRLRVEALVDGALERMLKEGARRGAIVVGAHFADLAERLLRERGTSFVKLVPDGVKVEPLLDASGDFLGVKHREHKLEQLFSGQPIRTEVEMLLESGNEELREERARDWSEAAQGYIFRYDVKRDAHARDMGAKCLERALHLMPDLSHALWLKGELCRLQGDTSAAVRLFEQVIRKEPRNGTYWCSKADALKQSGRARAAYRCYVRGIHVAPGSKELWTNLGLFLYYTGRERAACYCFFRGKKLKSEAARQDFEMVCHREPNFWDRPLSLQPAVIRLMNRFVLPLRYGWHDARQKAGLLVGAITSLVMAAYGAYLGFRAARYLGGLLGFFTLLLAWLVVAAVVLMNAAELSARRRVRNVLIARTVFGLTGAAAGYYVALTLSNHRWLPLASVTLMLIGAVVGASLEVLARLVFQLVSK